MLLRGEEIMTKSKSKLVEGKVTLKLEGSRIFFSFFLKLVSFLMNLSVVLILRLLLTDLMRPPLDHIKHAGLEKFGREFVIVLVLLPSIEQFSTACRNVILECFGFALLRFVICLKPQPPS